MRPGDTVLNVRILAVGSTRDGVERYRVVDQGTGEPQELLVFGGTDGESRRRFGRSHDALARDLDPGLARTREVKVEPARVLVLRDPLEDETLERLQGPADGPIVAAVTLHVARAVLASNGVTRGVLRPEDIGVSAQGLPVLAPRFGALAASERSSVQLAPERAPTDPAALYVLGTLAWRWLTGRAWARGSRATVARPGVDPRWDDVFGLLLHDDASRRSGALEPLRALAADVLDLRPILRALPATVPVKTTRTELAAPRVLLLVDAKRVEALSAADRSRLAGVVGLPDRVVDELAGKQLPVVIDGAASRRVAARKVEELAKKIGVEAQLASSGGLSGMWPRLFGYSVVGLVLGISAIFAVVALLPVAAVGAVVAAVGVGVTEWLARSLEASRTLHATGLLARNVARAALEDRSAQGRLDPAWQAIGNLKVQLAASAVPATAAADVRSVLRELERELESLAAGGRAVADAAAPDRGTLEARIRALDGQVERAEERARLVSTLRDLDALAARRQDLRAASQLVVDRVTRLSVALARFAATDDDDALDALVALVRERA